MSYPVETIAEQIIRLVEENSDEINKERFQTLEIQVQGGIVDGLRVKKYLKAKKK